MESQLLTLDILIPTYRPAGIEKAAAMLMEPMEGVRYVISWQKSEDAPIPAALASRPDVTVVRFEGTGVSLNRNNALRHCTADIVLCADDDVILIPEGIREVRQIYTGNPDLDFATFICKHVAGRVLPDRPTELKLPLPKGYYVGSWDLSFRREKALKEGLSFSPLLGINSTSGMHSAEDEFLLLCAIKKGWKCKFFPVEISIHDHHSTGTKTGMTPANVRGFGCYMRLAYPATWLPRIVLKAKRLNSSGRFGFFQGIAVMIQGALRAPEVRKGYW